MDKIIKKALDEGKALIGRKGVMKGIKTGAVKHVLYASNCPREWIAEFEYYGRISKVDIGKAEEDSAKLGQLCGKPFSITVIGVKK